MTAESTPPSEMSSGELLVEFVSTKIGPDERPGETLRDPRLTAVFTELYHRVKREATDGPPAPAHG